MTKHGEINQKLASAISQLAICTAVGLIQSSKDRPTPKRIERGREQAERRIKELLDEKDKLE